MKQNAFLTKVGRYWGDIAWTALLPFQAYYQSQVLQTIDEFFSTGTFYQNNRDTWILMVIFHAAYVLISASVLLCRIYLFKKHTLRDYSYLVVGAYMLLALLGGVSNVSGAITFRNSMNILTHIIAAFAWSRIAICLFKKWQTRRKPREGEEHDGNEE